MKKYQASSMAAALEAIRQELGPNAIILHSTEVRKGPLGLLSKPTVEVVAAAETPAPARAAPAAAARPPRPAPSGPAPSADGRAGRARPRADAAARPPRPPGAGDTGPGGRDRAAEMIRAIVAGHRPVEPDALREMQQHVKELRMSIGRMMQHAQWPGLTKLAPPLAELYRRLLDQEVEPELAQELVTTIDGELSLQAASDPAVVRDSLGKHLRRMLPTTGPLAPVRGEPTVLFLIGPTGVGKTTTIAKLAATLALQRHSVALITCDTFRVAAIPQLRTYADILRIPIEVAYTPEELTGKVIDHLDKDFIIVDTPGRSQRNVDQLIDLRRFVTAVPSRKTFLTLMAGSRYRDMLDVVARFGTVPFDGLLITKLDETSTFGPLLNLVRQTGKPITYLTNGQNVPHDLRVATPADLTDMLVGAAYAEPAQDEASGAAPDRSDEGQLPFGTEAVA